jgi:hypothetical protein
MVSRALESVGRQLLNQTDEGFFRCSVGVLVGTLVGLAIERLRVLTLPLRDLVLVDPDATVLDPGREAMQLLVVAVLADSGLVAVVPVVNAAVEVRALDAPVGEQSAAMVAAPVQDRDLVIVTHHDEVDVRHESVRGLAIRELIPVENLELVHDRIRGR